MDFTPYQSPKNKFNHVCHGMWHPQYFVCGVRQLSQFDYTLLNIMTGETMPKDACVHLPCTCIYGQTLKASYLRLGIWVQDRNIVMLATGCKPVFQAANFSCKYTIYQSWAKSRLKENRCSSPQTLPQKKQSRIDPEKTKQLAPN